MQIQSNLASTIAMAFDECVENPAEYSYAKHSIERTYRWLCQCIEEHDRLNALDTTINKKQMLFAINQGCTYNDLRIEHMKQIAPLNCDGYAIGGLAVGEATEVMYSVLDAVLPFAPDDKPRYLMGVGTPLNILEGVYRGIDFFDCVMPTRNARHGTIFTHDGTYHILNKRFETDDRPLEEGCQCPACSDHTRAYIHHLFKADEMLGMRLAVMHNLYFYNKLVEEIREAILNGDFPSFYDEYKQRLGNKI
jgi:queuine tRNA-ribosyltransferase